MRIMEKRFTQDSYFSGKKKWPAIERPTVHVSISTSLAPRSPEIVRTPPSPAKSSAGAIMDESHMNAIMTGDRKRSSSPVLPEIDRHPPLRHPEHNYQNTILEPQNRLLGSVSNRISHFSADSDSSGVTESDDKDQSRRTGNRRSWKKESKPLASLSGGLPSKETGTTNAPRNEDAKDEAQTVERPSSSPPRNSSADEARVKDNRPSTEIPTEANKRNTNISTIVGDASRHLSDLENLYRIYVGNGLALPSAHNPSSVSHNKCDCILGIHSITMEALSRIDQDSEELRHSGLSAAHGLEPFRSSRPPILAPPHCILQNAEAAIAGMPKYRSFSSPAATSNMKRVSMIPRIISNDHEVPTEYARTPYPTSEIFKSAFKSPHPTNRHQMHIPHTKPRAAPPIPPSFPPQDSIIYLSVRRRSARNYRRCLTTSLVVPNKRRSFTSTVAEKRLTEKRFPAPDFDDAVLFRRARAVYYDEFLGSRPLSRLWRRWCSARTLVAVIVVPCPSRDTEHIERDLMTQDFNTIGLALPHRPSATSIPSMDQPLCEESFFKSLQKPELGRSQYTWVQWTHEAAKASRLAATNKYVTHGQLWPQVAPGPQLEFIEGWSVGRLLTAGVGVLFASTTVLLLWVFLSGAPEALGAHDARVRVLTGTVLGVLVALLGGFGMLLWIALSWLVM